MMPASSVFLEPGTRYRYLGKEGVAIRKAPEFPGEKTNVTIAYQETFYACSTVTVDIVHLSVPRHVLFYQLADGRGWVQDFSPDHSEPMVVCEKQYRYIGDKEGVAVCGSATYPGEKTSAIIQRNEMFWATAVVKLTHQREGKTYSILMYKLADGRGWVHNFSVTSPGVPMVVAEDSVPIAPAVEVKLDGELQELQESVIRYDLKSRVWMKQHLVYKLGQLIVHTEKGGPELEIMSTRGSTVVLFPKNFENRPGYIWGITSSSRGMHVFEAATEDCRINWVQTCLQAGALPGGTTTKLELPSPLARSESKLEMVQHGVSHVLTAAGKAAKHVALEIKKTPSSFDDAPLQPFRPLTGKNYGLKMGKGPYAKLVHMLRNHKKWKSEIKLAVEMGNVSVTDKLIAFSSFTDNVRFLLWCDFAQTQWFGLSATREVPKEKEKLIFFSDVIASDKQGKLTFDVLAYMVAGDVWTTFKQDWRAAAGSLDSLLQRFREVSDDLPRLVSQNSRQALLRDSTLSVVEYPAARSSLSSASNSKVVLSWVQQEVGLWLSQADLGDFVDSFAQAEIDGATLLNLDDEALQEIGVSSSLRRKKILGKIQKLKEL